MLFTGRCTRGAFMQLLPFNSRFRKDTYLLLVDTEGLRAPELDATQTHNHDNQLGTFVIGLAHLTVINIYGEVLADMNDIIQTAVHAFLRMKHVTKLGQRCHFVHQNVPAVMANDKGMMGRTKIIENLDEMTKIAAKEEGLETHYTSFNDVIHFDDERNVTYFPGLWYGNPPMAPVNPKYSTTARDLKMALVMNTQYHTRRFSKFITYLETFWSAILKENFIFSFKNTLEMSVFSVLDGQRSKWFWTLRKEAMTSEDKFETQIHNFIRANDEEAYKRAKVEVVEYIAIKYAELRKGVVRFFEEHSHKEILVNWRGETERLLSSLHHELSTHANQHCTQVWCGARAKEKVNEIKSRHQAVISENVKELVSKLEKKLTPSQQEAKFEAQWNEWIKELEKRVPQEGSEMHDIKLDVQEALKEHFKKDKIIQKMNPGTGGKDLEIWGRNLSSKVEEKHIQPNPEMCHPHRSMRMSRNPPWKHLAEEETDIYLQEVEKYLNSKKGKDYFVTELLTQLQARIDEFKNDMFRFSIEYKMDLALTACGYALNRFVEMAKCYRDENDPVKSLGKEKDQYFQDFKDEYDSVAQEKIAARQWCELLQRAIEERITKSLYLKVVEKMEDDEVNSFLFTKPTLIKELLVHIGAELQKGDFSTCSKYLRYPGQTMEDYVRTVTEDYCNAGHPCKNLTLYARELLDENMAFVRGVLISIRRRNLKLSDWIDVFKNRLSAELIIHGTIRCALGTSKEIEHFRTELEKGLTTMDEILRKKLVLESRDMVRWQNKPYDVIFNRVSGCRAACPFCREPCDKISRDHDGDHTVNLHRPICLGGWRFRTSGKMTLSTCTEAVGNNDTFYISSDSYEKHPFRTCEQIYPKWHIQEDLPGETSLYWKYIVAHFKSELAKLYNMKEDSVPSHWMTFELTQAIRAL